VKALRGASVRAGEGQNVDLPDVLGDNGAAPTSREQGPMRQTRLLILATLLLPAPAHAEAPAPLPAAPTATSADPSRAIVKELAPLVQAHENDKQPTPDLLRTMARLAQAYAGAGEAKQPHQVWQKLLAAFERSGLPRNGGPEAALAAEARWRMLEPAVIKGMTVSFSPKPGTPHPWADMHAQLDEVLEATLGPKSKSNVGGEPGRAGGLVDQVLRVGEFKNPLWSVTAALQAGKLLLKQGRAMRDAARPGAVEGPEAMAVDAELKQTSVQFDERALTVLESAWKPSEEQSVTPALRTELRQELHKLKPSEYPVSEGGMDTEAVTPQQQEASRLAGLALKASRVDLKVMYLQKAVQLDPQNPRYQELLKAAQAEKAR
jgi:hypothetical protein